jgi:hypothetical protein
MTFQILTAWSRDPGMDKSLLAGEKSISQMVPLLPLRVYNHWFGTVSQTWMASSSTLEMVKVLLFGRKITVLTESG